MMEDKPLTLTFHPNEESGNDSVRFHDDHVKNIRNEHKKLH